MYCSHPGNNTKEESCCSSACTAAKLHPVQNITKPQQAQPALPGLYLTVVAYLWFSYPCVQPVMVSHSTHYCVVF